MGTSAGSSIPSDPAGIGPSTRTARAPAAASSLTVSGVVGPRGSRTAAPATRLYPSPSNRRSRALPPVTSDDLAAGERHHRGRDDLVRPHGAAERRLAGRQHAEPRAEEHVHRRARHARVGRATPSTPPVPAGAAMLP